MCQRVWLSSLYDTFFEEKMRKKKKKRRHLQVLFSLFFLVILCLWVWFFFLVIFFLLVRFVDYLLLTFQYRIHVTSGSDSNLLWARIPFTLTLSIDGYVESIPRAHKLTDCPCSHNNNTSKCTTASTSTEKSIRSISPHCFVNDCPTNSENSNAKKKDWSAERRFFFSGKKRKKKQHKNNKCCDRIIFSCLINLLYTFEWVRVITW